MRTPMCSRGAVRQSALVVLALGVVLASGCTEDPLAPGPPVDGGATADAGDDAGSRPDASDAGVDAGDAGSHPDAGDAEVDAGDGGSEPDATAPDADVDAGTPDGGLTCWSCHGSLQNPAPPTDLQGRTDSHEPTVGAHQAHLGARVS